MGLAGNHVAGLRVEIAEKRHRLDSPLDPLARPDQPPGQDDRGARRVRSRNFRAEIRRRPVRDHADALGLDHVHLEQPRAGGGALDDDAVGQLRQPLDDGALPVRGPTRNRVQHGDHRDGQLLDEIDHLVAVLAPEDPELVLEHDHVDAGESSGRGAFREALDPGTSSATTSGACGPAPGRSVQLTTIARWPEPAGAIARESAAVNVAIPHLVGG